MKGQIFLFFIVCCFLIFHPKLSTAQDHIKPRIEKIADQISGHIGVYALLLETGESISFHGDERFPMQSVYKFPIGMAVLDRIDKGKLSLGQEIYVDTSEYIPENGHSPLRDKFPGGVTVTVDQLLRYSVEESDGSASDVLLRLLGGTGVAEAYVHELGIADIAMATTEKIQVANDTVQYHNWATPSCAFSRQ